MMEEGTVEAQSKSRLGEGTPNWDRWVLAPTEDSWGDTANSHSWGSWVRLNVVQKTRTLRTVGVDMTYTVVAVSDPEEVTV
jgi:hypothetical protein